MQRGFKVSHVNEVIQNILVEHYQVPLKDIQSNMTFKENGIDSYHFIEFMVLIETKLGIEFDHDFLEVSHFKSLDDLTSYVEEIFNPVNVSS